MVRFNIILSFTPGSYKWLSFQVSPSQILGAFIFSLILGTSIDHLILFDFVIIFGEEQKLLSSLFSVASCYFLLRLKCSLQPLFSNTINLLFSINVRDNISHPHKTTGKMLFVSYFNLYDLYTLFPIRLHGVVLN
jgi:hypothetical protein